METYWVSIGFAGQFFFTMRFVVQWLASERRKRSVVPAAFWYFSLLGGLVLLVYAVHRRDPVFVAGQAVGLCIYLRNLRLLRQRGPRPVARGEDIAAGGRVAGHS